ncbi:MAG: RidA family protein [bacterium]|nr:RidA family protein [bacterium]
MPTKITTDKAPNPKGFYSQAVKAGDYLYLSGQLPLDVNGSIVGDSPAQHTAQTMRNIEAILLAAGARLHNLVQVTIYITNIDHWPVVNATYQEVMKHTPVPPARAIVPVKELHYGALVEIQAVAYLKPLYTY